jgi:hypothetical protein
LPKRRSVPSIEASREGVDTMSDPNDDIGPVNDDDATTSATDDSSVGFGNRPEEFLEDTAPRPSGLIDGGPPEEPGINKERDLDGRKAAEEDTAIDNDREATGIPGAPGTAAGADEEMPD